MLTVAIPKRNKLQNIIVLTPKDGSRNSHRSSMPVYFIAAPPEYVIVSF